MLSIVMEDKTIALSQYCQEWLRLLSLSDFNAAEKMLDKPNIYGILWKERELKKAVQDYFDRNKPVSFQNEEIANCYPECLETNGGSFIFGFYLPANEEITDLTVEFEFSQSGGSRYAATITMYMCFSKQAHNKQIMALAVARWAANTCAASPFARMHPRPILES